MTSTNDPLMRLQEHSGLPLRGQDVPLETLAEFIFQSKRGGSSLDLVNITNDIIRSLDVLNRQLNRVDLEASQRPGIARALVYAMSGIACACLEAVMELQRDDPQSRIAHDLITAAWGIQCAWDAFLAGDVENLQAHVALETEARARKGRV